LAQANRTRIILEAEAEAETIRLKGEAESFAIQAKAKADAEQAMKKAEAWREYKKAAILDMVLEALPKVIYIVLSIMVITFFIYFYY
jgi:flotillin